MRRNVLILFQLAVAACWVVGVEGEFYFGISTRGVPTSVVMSYWLRMLSGPLLLLAGSITLFAEGSHRRFMSTMALIGSVVSAYQALRWIAPTTGDAFEAGDYGFATVGAALVGVTVASSVIAYILYREFHRPVLANGG